MPRDLCELVGDASQALVLAQVLYWFDETEEGNPRTQAEFKGKLFLAKTHEELGSEIGLTARRVKSCIAALKKSGLLLVEYHMFNDKRVSHLVPIVEEISGKLDRLRDQS